MKQSDVSKGVGSSTSQTVPPTDASLPVDPCIAASMNTTEIQWKETDPMVFQIYARGHEKKTIEVLMKTPIGWTCLESHPLGLAYFQVGRASFPSRGVFDAVMALTTLHINATEAICDPSAGGMLRVWPDRVKAGGQWRAAERWSAAKPLPDILALCKASGGEKFSATVTAFGRHALVVQAPGLAFCDVREACERNGLLTEAITRPQLTTAFLEVTSPPDRAFAQGHAVAAARQQLQERYPTLRWGVVDSGFVGHRVVVMVDRQLTAADTYATEDDKGFRARFYLSVPTEQAGAARKAEIQAVVERVRDTTIHILKRRTFRGGSVRPPTSGGSMMAEDGAMLDDSEESDDSSSPPSDLPEEEREMRMAVVQETADQLSAALGKVAAVLGRCNVGADATEAAMGLVAASVPAEDLKFSQFVDALKAVTGPAQVMAAVQELGRSDGKTWADKAETWASLLKRSAAPPPVRMLNQRAPPKSKPWPAANTSSKQQSPVKDGRKRGK